MIKFKKEHIDFKITKKPFMIKNNIWWYVAMDENGYIQDMICTTKQYYKIYKHKNKGSDILNFDTFLNLAKAGEIVLK
jgi:hypothetical protein